MVSQRTVSSHTCGSSGWLQAGGSSQQGIHFLIQLLRGYKEGLLLAAARLGEGLLLVAGGLDGGADGVIALLCDVGSTQARGGCGEGGSCNGTGTFTRGRQARC